MCVASQPDSVPHRTGDIGRFYGMVDAADVAYADSPSWPELHGCIMPILVTLIPSRLSGLTDETLDVPVHRDGRMAIRDSLHEPDHPHIWQEAIPLPGLGGSVSVRIESFPDRRIPVHM